MTPIDATSKKNRRDWTFTWYQKYYRLLADWKVKKLRKYDKRGRYQGHGLEYHHVKPVSIYGVANNLIVVVPGNVHASLIRMQGAGSGISIHKLLLQLLPRFFDWKLIS